MTEKLRTDLASIQSRTFYMKVIFSIAFVLSYEQRNVDFPPIGLFMFLQFLAQFSN